MSSFGKTNNDKKHNRNISVFGSHMSTNILVYISRDFISNWFMIIIDIHKNKEIYLVISKFEMFGSTILVFLNWRVLYLGGFLSIKIYITIYSLKTI